MVVAEAFLLGVLLVGIVGFLLWIWALIDAIQVPDDRDYRTGSKLVWIIVIVFVPVFVGPILYLALGRPASS